jgi:Uma2 family endonuclease
VRKNKIVSQTTGIFVTLGMTLPDKIFQPERYTYQDYKKWEGKWELINGFPVAMSPSPNRRHQEVGANFLSLIKTSLKKNASLCNCSVYYELDWIINEETIVRPDVMIVCGNFETDFLTFPPSLVLELPSPPSRMRDRNTKFTLYEMCGVNYYLIADTDKNSIEIFQLRNNKYQQITDTTFTLTNNCILELDLTGIWN